MVVATPLGIYIYDFIRQKAVVPLNEISPANDRNSSFFTLMLCFLTNKKVPRKIVARQNLQNNTLFTDSPACSAGIEKIGISPNVDADIIAKIIPRYLFID